MRAGIAGHSHAAFFRLAYQLNGAFRADMRDMQPCPAMLRKNQVPRYDDFLRLSGHSRKAKAGSGITLVHHAHTGKPPVLAVGNDRQIEHFGILHNIPQKSSGICKFIAV